MIKYTSHGPYKNVEEALDFIKNYDQYEKYKLGRLSAFIKSTGEYIGWCGLKCLETNKTLTWAIGFQNSTGAKAMQQKQLTHAWITGSTHWDLIK